ncbi:MAG: hypothetical protein JHC61_02425 [Burkholderiaceae bacterium]|nr:hypothetical protein [Burkholderiaceae bacterium]
MLKKALSMSTVVAACLVTSTGVWAADSSVAKAFDLTANVGPKPFTVKAVNKTLVNDDFDAQGYPVFHNIKVEMQGGSSAIQVKHGGQSNPANRAIFMALDGGQTDDWFMLEVFDSVDVRLHGILSRQVAKAEELVNRSHIVSFTAKRGNVQNNNFHLVKPGLYRGELTLIFEPVSAA